MILKFSRNVKITRALTSPRSVRPVPPVLSALQFSLFTINLVSSFIDDFLFTSFQQRNEIKKAKYPNEIQIFTFLYKQMNDLFYVEDVLHRFPTEFDRW